MPIDAPCIIRSSERAMWTEYATSVIEAVINWRLLSLNDKSRIDSCHGGPLRNYKRTECAPTKADSFFNHYYFNVEIYVIKDNP